MAIVAAFVLANSQYEFDSKLRGFAAVVIGYLTFCLIAYWSGDGNLPFFINGERGHIPEGQIESKLFSIEEAGKYFGRSLKSSDMFRLMASRINDLVSFDLCVLLMVDGSSSSKCVLHADGENAYKLKGIESTLDVGLAGKSFASGTVQLGVPGICTDISFPEDALHEFRSSIALPLVDRKSVV